MTSRTSPRFNDRSVMCCSDGSSSMVAVPTTTTVQGGVEEMLGECKIVEDELKSCCISEAGESPVAMLQPCDCAFPSSLTVHRNGGPFDQNGTAEARATAVANRTRSSDAVEESGAVLLSALAASAADDDEKEEEDDYEEEEEDWEEDEELNRRQARNTLEIYQRLVDDEAPSDSDRYDSLSSIASSPGLPPLAPRLTESSRGRTSLKSSERQEYDDEAEPEIPTAEPASNSSTGDPCEVSWRPPTPRLKRQGAMSDLWQHQAAYRTNRRSMKSMFTEFVKSLELPENKGRNKAQIKDIFSFTAVGYKHLVTQSSSEDRIAIQQAVVPTIDEDSKRELEIDTIDTTPFSMFGVFDGHGGPACAEFLKNSVSTVLAHSPVLYDEDLSPFERRACATATSFTELEKVHNDWARAHRDLSGSTAILSTFQDGVLVMAGVGDSAGLYVDHEGNQNMLCPQHSTSNAREVERVLSMGGTIINNRVAGCLVPTRTIGDLDCKQELGNIVSPHPEIKLAAIYAPPDDGEDHDEPFLVLASDGLWDVLSVGEVSFLVHRGLRQLRAKTEREAAKVEKAKQKLAREKEKEERKQQRAREKEAAAAARRAGSNGGSGKGAREKRIRSFPRILSPNMSGRSLSNASSDGGRSLASGRISGLLERIFDNNKGDIRSRDSSNCDEDYLDLNSSIGELDASIRGGSIASATLDESLYAGMRAQGSAPNGIVPMEEEEPSARTGVKPVAMSSTAATAGIRTSGSPTENVAMHLAHAAIRASSTDDISVVVVTFQGGQDKSPPGSRNTQRKPTQATPTAPSSIPATPPAVTQD